MAQNQSRSDDIGDANDPTGGEFESFFSKWQVLHYVWAGDVSEEVI